MGDKLTAGGVEFEIVGIGTTPDYDTPFENFSDTAVSSKGFGLLFVSDDQYDYFKMTAIRKRRTSAMLTDLTARQQMTSLRK